MAVLRGELAFLVGCVNLQEALGGAEARFCMPEPSAPAEAGARPVFTATGLLILSGG